LHRSQYSIAFWRRIGVCHCCGRLPLLASIPANPCSSYPQEPVKLKGRTSALWRASAAGRPTRTADAGKLRLPNLRKEAVVGFLGAEFAVERNDPARRRTSCELPDVAG
jgi:hypothetical protein